MLAAKLDTEITFEIEVTTTSSIGTPEETYSFLKKKWATVAYRGGSTAGDSYAERTATDTDFTVRYDEDINYKCRIVHNNSIYVIKHIEPIQRKVGLRIRTRMLEIN